MGIEFASLEIAYLEAYRAARDIWHELLVQRRDPRLYGFEICDAAGRLLLELPFLEVLESNAAVRPIDRKRTVAVRRAASVRRLAIEIEEQLTVAREAISLSRSLLAR